MGDEAGAGEAAPSAVAHDGRLDAGPDGHRQLGGHLQVRLQPPREELPDLLPHERDPRAAESTALWGGGEGGLAFQFARENSHPLAEVEVLDGLSQRCQRALGSDQYNGVDLAEKEGTAFDEADGGKQRCSGPNTKHGVHHTALPGAAWHT